MEEHPSRKENRRDTFRSGWGFVLASVGSAVGMGNIWLFPKRVSEYGGAAFLIPYLIFVCLIASTGVIGETAFGRAAHAGPMGAFGMAAQRRFGTPKPGKIAGLLPVAGSLALATGYSVVVGWILKYLGGCISGEVFQNRGLEQCVSWFEQTASAYGNSFWQTIGVLVTALILIFGIGGGIERANKVMMPLFFCMFLALAVYIAFLPGAQEGYRYIFWLDVRGLRDPMVWIFALGQAFFSLSVAGNGTLIYGSYLSETEDIPRHARMVAFFDTMAAMLAAMVIIPAMATAGQQLSSGGPGLMFIYLPNLFLSMPGGRLLMMLFFVAVFFAGLSSLLNLFEAPIGTVQELFSLQRPAAVCLVCGSSLAVSLVIQGVVSEWMDVCSIYICPLGAALAGIFFFWFLPREEVLHQVNLSRKKPLGNWFYPMAKYLFCGLSFFVLVAGAVLGGIG